MTVRVDICAYDALDDGGGPYVWIQSMPLKLMEMGFDIRVNLFSWHSPEEGYAYRFLTERGVPVRTTIFSDAITNVRWLLKLAEANRPDVFVANLVVPAFYAASYLKSAGVATVGILRSDDSFYHAIADKFVYSPNSYQLSTVVCVSKFLCQLVDERSGNSIPSFHIPSGTPIPYQRVTRPGIELKIAYVGRLVEEQKQASLLTHALVRVVSEIGGVEVAMYGDGPARENVQRIIEEANSANLHLMGYLPNAELKRRLLDTHVVVLLSDYEGSPTAIMEAMACGCVPVCLDIRSGIPELVEDGVTGLLVKDRGQNFVSAIRRLKDSPDLWQELSNNARTRAECHFSTDLCATKWANLLASYKKDSIAPEPFFCPEIIKLPATSVGFAHQDWRTPTGLVRLLSEIKWRYIRARMFLGKVRRHLVAYIPSSYP